MSEATQPNHKREFVGTVERLPAIREFVADAVTALGGDEECIFASELAVDEAATNAFVHAYGGMPGRVQVELWREGDLLVIVVRNWGSRFDPEAVPEPDPEAPLFARPAGGLGLYLIRQLMSRVSFAFDTVAGNTVIMQRALFL